MVEPESANVCGLTEFRAAQPTTPLDWTDLAQHVSTDEYDSSSVLLSEPYARYADIDDLDRSQFRHQKRTFSSPTATSTTVVSSDVV